MTSEKERSPGGIDRRDLLKAAGTATAGIAAFSGTASAHPPDEVRFCECSRVCVDSDRSYRVIYAVEANWMTTCSLEPATSEPAESTPGCFEADDGETIIGVLGGTRNVYWNPNACAEMPLDVFSLADCDGCDDGACSDRVTYWRVGPNEYAVGGEPVTVRTDSCEPPSEWDDELEFDLRGSILGPL